ncbi:MAG: hypothetical protein ACOCQM_05915 [Natronomonas sp.]
MSSSYKNKLKYAGGKPFKKENGRLPHPVAEVLAQDTAYMRLAQLRYLADQAHEDAPDVAEQATFGAWNSASQAVDEYVRDWIDSNAAMLVTDWELDEEDVMAACEEYGVEFEVAADA